MDSEIVNFPLRGDWVAFHTPADKIPTHGTDVMGMRYAYDILKIRWREKGIKFYKKSSVSYWLKGVMLKDCLGYGETLFSPFDGTVVETYSEYPERRWLHPIYDYILGHGKSVKFVFSGTPEVNSELVPIIGNHIIIKMNDKEIYALCAHLQKDSLNVVVGEKVEANQAIAKIGHSGNSTAPHLHFQLMDRADLMSAQGIHCAFYEYEIFEAGKWKVIQDGVPEKLIPLQYT
ncbi:hypothetical protein MNBD_GAMMA01-354 [hydrothermal vent metagenome]|uniref:M23ase beta-sheet core domain-containing protein n=1 Tax=hydrothermal vent metagenome TaxID=652676 RepID=A0A3B0VB15_9ZZZZ